ncbi:unconventional myosin-XVIIIa isoform X2 [Culex pipiens pallens]|uniref:unconventional myosin-XVIIIa isoform X2 n=1 Tax=Culex pipiens pallens TaxID=42434 RepID=UPI001952FFD4|nr:unconventional myosin-XVIIIa isoform X2 [Culex pipiens pallens]
MSMHQFQRSFEQSLRSSYGSGPVITTSVLTPVKKEIHRGCTGKAHACGTLKTLKHTPVTDRSFRKGSFSSDTISDTSSEISQQNSTDRQTSNEVKPAARKLRLVPSFRRKTTDNIPSPEEITHKSKRLKVRGRLYSDGDKSDKSSSDGKKQELPPQPQPPKQHHNRLQHSQSFHLHNRRPSDSPGSPLLTARYKLQHLTCSTTVGSSNGVTSTGSGSKSNGMLMRSVVQRRSSNPADSVHHNNNNNNHQHMNGRSNLIPASAAAAPPLERTNGNATGAGSGTGTTTTTAAAAAVVTTVNANGAGFSRALRNSFRNRLNSVQWRSVWEHSFSVKPGGGVYKTFDKLISSKIKSNFQCNEDQENGHESGEKVWLIHRGGFTAASKLPQSIISDPGKTLVQLEHNGENLSVDDDDVEKANPESLDLVEDICQLRHLNEASVLHVLRQRYASNLIHTRAGPVLMVVNPMAPLSLYSEKVVSMFRGCKTEDMPPHVFSLAQTAYRTMLETRRDQSLVFMGRSGSGKTTSFKHALYYLALAAGSANKILTAERVSAMNTILEAFGNAKTCLNTNATRFTQILSLDFDHCGQIASASIQILLLEKSRAGRRTSNDHHTFHVFGRLLAGAEGHLQKELYLDNINFDEGNLFVTLPSKLEEKQNASLDFARLQQAFSVLNVDPSSVKALWFVLAAIFHLGSANCSIVGTGSTARIQFANPSAARKASNLLGISMDDLTTAAFSNATSKSNPASPTKSGASPTSEQQDLAAAALDSLEGFVIGLYSEVVAAAIALVNKAISTTSNTIASILLIDTPGFQNPASCGQQTGASLSDLRHNYLQERLQLLFHHVTLVAPRNRYAQELVEINAGFSHDSNPGPLVNLLDKAPQSHVVRTSQNNLRDQDKRGLLWMLDEETMYPNSNDDTFLERLFSSYGDRESQTLVRRGAGTRQFILQHMQGTNPVLYSSSGWLKGSHEHPSTKCAISVLQDSTKTEISSLFTTGFARSGGTVYFGSIVGTEGTQSLRRVSSIRRSFTSAGIKRNSVMLQVKFTVDGIIDTLRRTGTHFVHCYLLLHNAGTTNYMNLNTKALQNDDIVNVPLLRSQLRGSQILDFARLHRLGFPVSVPLSEFTRRFGLLADGTFGEITVENILNHNEIDPSVYRIGPSQVLFRSGVLNQLEAKRDELLSDRIIQLQSYCRGHLARKRLAQRRVQELAVKCIQRNVRAFMKVREWPWWRLLVRVTPLLNVHRTEEQLKIATTELQVLKSKLEKVEGERNSLKTENSKLESRLSEMTAEFAEEHSSSNLISERLEAETTERLRLEKEVKEHETKYRNLQESSEKLEMELLCAKSDLNGDLDDDLEGDEAGANAYRLKYERVARELEFTKKRLQTQHEHDLEQLIALKKQLEKKLADAYEEVEEQRQVVGQWKRKAQKMTNEMNDLRMLLEEQNSRNNLLEKRQRKFDSECQALQDSARQEKQAKERLTREKDVLIAEKFTIEQTLSDVRLELELKEEKYSALQRELEEMTFGGGTEEEIAQLKRQKMELDRRCKEQEEELDEMAGQIQLLEQAKLRLEMSLETMRKDARKEAQQRDDELEEVRGSSYKKIKSLECQLEQEHEERTLLLREKHDLERRLNNLEDQDRVERAAEEAASQKLKRDLRKYKALLRDAQSQLERAKSDSAGKALIRQLRNQLEDAESARSAAVKVRQVAESELQDVQLMLEEAQRARFDSEERATAAQRDRAELQAQIDENDEEMAELMKKYSATVKQLSSEQAMITDYELKISELESEKKSLKEQISDLTSRLESVENIGDSSTSIQFKRLELRTKELESRLEFEQATRARMEIQLNRHKDSLEKAQSEISQTRTKEMHAQEALKKAQKTIRELREELHLVANKEQESLTKRKDLEKRLECVEAEAASARADLRLALQRIADLQQAMEEGDSYHSDSENSDSSIDSVSEVNYHSPTKISSLRARSGETNGTGTNGSSTTLCIREEKENTPRIRYKYKPRGLRRRRLPFTIAEEDEAEDGVRPCEDLGNDDASQLDSVIESIKSAIGDEVEEDGADDGETNKVPPAPKYTGAIKKTVIGKSPVSIKDELELSDANNNVIPKGQNKTLESTIVAEIAKASTVVADHLNDDSRFDLTALKSIKEKIKSLNNSLKEEAAQERCCKYEFPPPPPIVLSASQSKLESARIPDKATNDSFSKLDQISAELNLEGIRSMKEKIRNLKKRLQDESGSSEEPINKAQIASEIVEMKKTLTLTAAFINKSSEKLSLSRSSSQKEEKAPTLAPPTTNGHSKETSPALSSGSRSPVRNNSTPIVPRSLAVAQVSNGVPRGAAFEESRLVSSLEQGSPPPPPLPEEEVKTAPKEEDAAAAVNNSPPSSACSSQPVDVSNLIEQSPLQCEAGSLPTTSGSCEETECKEEKMIVEGSEQDLQDEPEVVAKELSESLFCLPEANTSSEAPFALKITLNSINTAKAAELAEDHTNKCLEENADSTNTATATDLKKEEEDSNKNPELNKDSANSSMVVPEDVKVDDEIKSIEFVPPNTCFNIECRTSSTVCKCENIEQTIELLVKSMEVHRDEGSVVSEVTSHEVLQEKIDVPNVTSQVLIVQQEATEESIIPKEMVSTGESDEIVVPINQPADVEQQLPVTLVASNTDELVETVPPIVAKQTEEVLSIVDDLEKPLQIENSNEMINTDVQLIENLTEIKPPEEVKQQPMPEEVIPHIDENNNQDKPAQQVPPPTANKETKATLKPSKSKPNCHHGSLKRNVKPDNSKIGFGSKSNPSSRRSSLSSEHGAKPANTIFTDLAKGGICPAEKKQVVEVVPPPTLSNVVPTEEDMSKNQVSERALVEFDCTNESSSCCSVVAPSAAVSTDVVVVAPSKGSPSPRPLSYAESLKKARSPPKVEPWVAIKQEYDKKAAAAKARKQQQQQQPRVRHPSLARNGSSSSIPRDGSVTIRQSKSATKVYAKDANLSLSLPSGKPNVEPTTTAAKPATQNRSKSGQRNGTAQQLVAKDTNKSNSNLVQDKKLREAKGQSQQSHQHHRQSRQTTASNSSSNKKK